MNWQDVLGALGSAFVGTFVGAYVAFRLERNARASEEVRQRATDGNLALLTLLQMFNNLRQFEEEIIGTAPDPAGRWLKMRVTFPQTGIDLRFDAPHLAFLLECDDTNLLQEVLLEERRFKLAIDMINRRSHLMLEKVHPKMAAAGIQRGQNIVEKHIQELLGPALSAEAEQLAEGIVVNVREDIQSLRQTFDKLRLALLALLPGQKFMKAEFPMPTHTDSGEQLKPDGSAKLVGVDVSRVYSTVIEHERHVENRAWSTLGNFLAVNAFLLVAWATLYEQRDHAGGFQALDVVLFALSLIGYVGGLKWALLGARNWEYVREIVKYLRTLETHPHADATAKELVSNLRGIEDTVVGRWKVGFPSVYQVVVLSAGPLVISILYLCTFEVVLWRFIRDSRVMPWIWGAVGLVGVAGIYVYAKRCVQSKKASD